MNSGFAVIRFDSWEDAFSCATRMDNWFFRGHADASWRLESSLERAAGVDAGDSFRWDHIEKWMLRQFKGSAHHHLAHTPDDDDLLEWVALMQHHGAPTRLLDCTYSFPVATFFAAKDATSEFAIWGFNWHQLRLSACSRFGLDDKVKNSAYDFHVKMHEMANLFLKREASGALVFPVDPTRQNERRAAQQGLFLFPCDPTSTFMHNLACLFPDGNFESVNDDCHVTPYDRDNYDRVKMSRLKLLKFILPHRERRNTLDELYKMNIHEASLFPGLDGFARSLKRYTFRDD